MEPLFDIGDSFPSVVKFAGDESRGIEPIKIPVTIKRLSREEMEAFEKRWDKFVEPRGAATLTPEEKEANDRAALDFYETSIKRYVTLEEGLIKNLGKWVVDGEGIIAVFHSRSDILARFIVCIYAENKLAGAIRKNLKLPQGSDTGSAVSTSTSGKRVTGVEPVPVASGAENSNSATDEGATEKSNETPSGATRQVH